MSLNGPRPVNHLLDLGWLPEAREGVSRCFCHGGFVSNDVLRLPCYLAQATERFICSKHSVESHISCYEVE